MSDLIMKKIPRYFFMKLKIKHKIVLEYMNRHDLDVNSDEIQQQINKDPVKMRPPIYRTKNDQVPHSGIQR